MQYTAACGIKAMEFILNKFIKWRKYDCDRTILHFHHGKRVCCVFIQTLEYEPFEHKLVLSNAIQDDKKKNKYKIFMKMSTLSDQLWMMVW